MKKALLLSALTAMVLPGLSQVQQDPAKKQDQLKVVTTVYQPVGIITLPGFNFEKGKSALEDWAREGTAFNNQPAYGHNVVIRREMDNAQNPFRIKIILGGDYWKDLSLPVGHKGNYWIDVLDVGKILQPAPILNEQTPARASSRMFSVWLLSFIDSRCWFSVIVLPLSSTRV